MIVRCKILSKSFIARSSTGRSNLFWQPVDKNKFDSAEDTESKVDDNSEIVFREKPIN